MVFLTIFAHKGPAALGALLTCLWPPVLDSRALGIAPAISIGAFLRVALSDLLPEAHKHLGLRNRNLAAFLGGLPMMAPALLLG